MRFPLVLLLICVGAASADAQQLLLGRAAVAADSVLTTIQLADAQGAQRATLPAEPAASQVSIRAWQPTGTAEHKCVEVNEQVHVRSGDILAAGFSHYRGVWYSGWGKINWLPYHPTPEAPTQLVIRAARLDAAAPPWIFERPGDMATADRAHTMDFSYPTGFYLPTTGRWLLVATAGLNWGCFIYNLS